MHLVHRNPVTGKLAVVGVLMVVPPDNGDYPRDDQGENLFLTGLGWHRLPDEGSDWTHEPDTDEPNVNAFQLLPPVLQFYHYHGIAVLLACPVHPLFLLPSLSNCRYLVRVRPL